MEIREATEGDIPEILEVLKASLGEISSRKTERVWRYKHVENPFGKSLVLLAVESEKVVGVRAFMRWTWQNGEKEFSAFRAVDTATHPDHQGKGIFKKLTLKALQLGEMRGDNFVFNTPNSQSKPGYLKMGWEEIGKLKVKICPVNPFIWKKANKKNTQGSGNFPLKDYVLKEFFSNLVQDEKMFTPRTKEYLEWRYQKNPLQEYLIDVTPEYYISGYVKNQRKVRELRITEVIFVNEHSKQFIRRTIRDWARLNKVHFISLPPFIDLGFHLELKLSLGPIMTLRRINLSDLDYERFLKLKSWKYSLGDLELF